MLARRIDIESEVLGDPAASLWGRSPAQKVALFPTPVAMQPSKYILAKWRDGQFGLTSSAGLQAVHNGSELALRLEWECDVPAASAADNDQFADAAAVLFPLSDAAPLTMGAQGAPVNIWYWRADRPKTAFNNLADGIGTSRVTSSPVISTRAVHEGGRWAVVFRRALAAAAPVAADVAQFEPGKHQRVALAIWKGSNAERAGLKAFSAEWVELTVEA